MNKKQRIWFASILLRAIALALVALAAFGSGAALSSCSPSVRTLFIPKNAVVDTSGPHYLQNVSEIKYWDRISQANRATNFAWMDSSGKTLEMNEYYNKVVVLTFFNSESIPSLAQLSAIDSIRSHGDTNVLWIGVGMNEGLNGRGVLKLDSFARVRSIDYELLVGIPDFGFTYSGIDVVPTTFVITTRRKISDTFEGLVREAELSQAISTAEKAE